MGDLFRSVVRTFVPVVVGLIMAGLAKAGIEMDSTALTTVIDALFVGGYYVVIRLLERRFPAVGWLLGLPVTPTYERPSDDTNR